MGIKLWTTNDDALANPHQRSLVCQAHPLKSWASPIKVVEQFDEHLGNLVGSFSGECQRRCCICRLAQLGSAHAGKAPNVPHNMTPSSMPPQFWMCDCVSTDPRL